MGRLAARSKCTGLLVGLLLASGWGGHWCTAHDLPDGQVERALQVTAYPDHIELRYQFGMSERTLCEQWKPELAMPAGETLPEAELRALEAEYLSGVAEELVAKVAVIVAGQRPPRGDIRVELIYQHHLQFECRVIYPISLPAEATPLQLIDQNFATYPGYYRAAVRGRGGLVAVSDTAPPLLVRAPRLPIQAEQRGRLVVPPLEATLSHGELGTKPVETLVQVPRTPPAPFDTGLATEEGLADPAEAPPLIGLVESQGRELDGDWETAAVGESPDAILPERLESIPLARATEGLAPTSLTSIKGGAVRTLPTWMVGGGVVLIMLSCLPFLLARTGASLGGRASK